MRRELAKQFFTIGGKDQLNLAAICTITPSPHEAPFRQPVYQFHRAVRLNLKAIRQRPHARTDTLRQSLQSQQELVLVRLHAGLASCLFAEVQKLTQLIA